MNDDETPIDRALGLGPIENTSDVLSTIVAEARDDSAKEDFTFAGAIS